MKKMTTFEIPFQCGVANGSQGGWCLGGGTCFVDDLGVESCIECGSGWTHDYTWAHQDNCGLPVLFLPMFFVYSTFCTVCGSLLIAWKWRTISSKLRLLVKLYLLCTYLEWVENLALWLENGRFTVTHLLIAVRTIFTSLFFIELTLLMVRALVAVLRPDEIRRAAKIAYALVFTPGLVCAALSVLQAATIRTRTNAASNFVSFWLFTIGCLYILCTLGSCMWLITRVLNSIKKKNGTELPPAVRPAVKRLRIMRNFLFHSTFGGPIGVIYESIMLGVFGSVPFNWLMLFFISSMAATFPGFVFFLSKYDGQIGAGNGEVQNVAYREMSTYRPMSSAKSKSEPPTLQLEHPPSVLSWHSSQAKVASNGNSSNDIIVI